MEDGGVREGRDRNGLKKGEEKVREEGKGLGGKQKDTRVRRVRER